MKKKIVALALFAILLLSTVTLLTVTHARMEDLAGSSVWAAKTWHWVSNTYIMSVAVGDVDGDGSVEIVTGGYYWDWIRDVAQLAVWNGATLALERVKTWYWTSDTRIDSVALGDVDGDGKTEIVTGGSHYDGMRFRAQLCVWDGATLALERVKTWYWTGNTLILSVAIGDVDGDGKTEIVTGGYCRPTPLDRAQLCVWDGATLNLEGMKTWYLVSNTRINSVAVGDVDGDGVVEIVTGGDYWTTVHYWTQLCVWDGATLAGEGMKTWYWVDDTRIYSVACGNVDGDGKTEIVTGGYYHDGTRKNAQLAVWNGDTLALEGVRTWYWWDHTDIESVAINNVDDYGPVDIITGGYCSSSAQLAVWNGDTLTFGAVQVWHWGLPTFIESVAVSDVDGDGEKEIVTGGGYYDGTRYVAQLVVWNVWWGHIL